MALHRVRTSWNNAAAVGGGVTTMFFDEAVTPVGADLIPVVKAFWDATDDLRPTAAVATIEAEVATFNAETGALEAVASGTALSSPGASGGEYLPLANQALIRLVTNGLRNNRQVKGRIFLPAVVEGAVLNGQLDTTSRAACNAACVPLIAAGLQVWSRPVNDAGGEAFPVTSVAALPKMAVLRSRRD